MPGGDRTGPMGAGSMTGRGMGVCAGRPNSAVYLGAGRFVRGCGMGFGGRGRRNRFWAAQPVVVQADDAMYADQELSWLKQQATTLKENLENVANRIQQLEKTAQHENSDKQR